LEAKERGKFERMSPGLAKRVGRTLELREDWEQVKEAIMELLLWEKFKDEPLRTQLLETGTASLVEGNYWGDRYWGVCRGEGKNRLGVLLMRVRANLRRDGREKNPQPRVE
jgi:hypothetical protein